MVGLDIGDDCDIGDMADRPEGESPRRVLVEVDMTSLAVRVAELPGDLARLGGRGLTSALVSRLVPPTSDPLGPDNVVVIAPGLLAGTKASSSGRLSIGAKSPLTGGIKEANAGGSAARRLARLGIAAVVVRGQAASPGANPRRVSGGETYKLVLSDEEPPKLVQARELSGLGVYKTAEVLLREHGNRASVICVGPAGERGMLSAGVTNTDPEGSPGRFCARGGLGAVLGVKGLKAVVLVGAGKPVRPARGDLFDAAVSALHDLISTTPQTAQVYHDFGTAGVLPLTNSLGGLPTRNFSTGRFEDAEFIGGDHLRKLLGQRNGRWGHGCMPGCLIRCSNVFVDEAGRTVVSPLEYETIGLVGSNCGISSLDDIARINALCNDLGVDTLEIGGALAICMDAGVIPFGDARAAYSIVKEIAQQTVLGRVIGNGGAVTATVMGVRGAPVVKGQVMPAYEPRAIKGLGVTYATSPMGPDHTAGNVIRQPLVHSKKDGQLEASRKAQISAALYDTLGMCLFAGPAVRDRLDVLRDLHNGLLGEEASVEDLLAGARVTLRTELEFNRRAGLGPELDRLPEYFYRVPNPATGSVFDFTDEELRSVLADL